jgi:hypothetical protein
MKVLSPRFTLSCGARLDDARDYGMMKQSWFTGGVLCAIAYAVLRLVTLNGSSPAWAANLRPLALIAALVCLLLAGQLKFTRQDLVEMYERKARNSLFVGLICLILIPIALWIVYVRYYGALITTLNNGG